MTQVYVKLLNRGLKASEHEKFLFEMNSTPTIQGLIEDLVVSNREQFQVYLENEDDLTLRRDAIVIVNGKNMVAREGLQTRLSDGDIVVFMIAAVGG